MQICPLPTHHLSNEYGCNPLGEETQSPLVLPLQTRFNKILRNSTLHFCPLALPGLTLHDMSASAPGRRAMKIKTSLLSLAVPFFAVGNSPPLHRHPIIPHNCREPCRDVATCPSFGFRHTVILFSLPHHVEFNTNFVLSS